MNRLSTTESHRPAEALGGRTGATAGAPSPYLVLDLAAAVTRTRRAVAGAAGAAAGGQPPPRPRPSMPATRRTPTAGAAARPAVCG